MIDSTSERRMAENEMVFRQANDQIRESLEEVKKRAVEEGLPRMLETDEMKLDFYCECSDENCRERISMSVGEYKRAHTKKNEFTVLPSHEVLAIERILRGEPNYFVVEKLIDPPETDPSLHTTSVDNV
jgi:hypothetical protein